LGSEAQNPALSPLVVGLVGATGSGKTTIAKALVTKHGFENLHMGRPLKDMLIALGLSEQAVAGTPADREAPQPVLDGKSARFALSTLGTKWGRNTISPRIWANAVRAKIQMRAQAADPRPIVIDDLRFPTDWDVVTAFGGSIVRIRRPSVETGRSPLDKACHRLRLERFVPANGLFGWTPLHETEFHWRDAPCIGEIDNTAAVTDAVAAVIALLVSQRRWLEDAAASTALL